jgi:hypothetical protein
LAGRRGGTAAARTPAHVTEQPLQRLAETHKRVERRRRRGRRSPRAGGRRGVSTTNALRWRRVGSASGRRGVSTTNALRWRRVGSASGRRGVSTTNALRWRRVGSAHGWWRREATACGRWQRAWRGRDGPSLRAADGRLKIRHDGRDLGIVRGEIAVSSNSRRFPRFHDGLQQSDLVPHFIRERTELVRLLCDLCHEDPPRGELLGARATGRGAPLLGGNTRGQEQCGEYNEHEDSLRHADPPFAFAHSKIAGHGRCGRQLRPDFAS